MTSEIRFVRRTGGFIVTYMRAIVGMILEPHCALNLWRFVSQWGDVCEFPTLHDAQVWASECLLLDANCG